MSSEFKPTYIHYGPSDGRPGRGYLMRVTSPEASEFGNYEYFRIWVTVPKDMPNAIPTNEGFKTYRKVSWETDMDPGALSASLMTTHDVYEFTSDEPPTLQRDNTSYHPYGRGNDQAYCIINSVVVCFNGATHARVVEALAAYAKYDGQQNGAVLLKELRPYVLQTDSSDGKKVFLFRDSERGTDTRYVTSFRVGADEALERIGELGPITVRNKQLTKSENLRVGDVPDAAYNEAALIVFGVVSSREDGKWRRVMYGTGSAGSTTEENRRAMSNEVHALEKHVDPPQADPVPPSVTMPTPAPAESESSSVEIPASERRTRAQLYAALIVAEKFGDRTIRPSKFETNARLIGTDTYSHELVVREAPNLTQGELVSLVTLLVNRIVADDVIVDAYNKAKSEGRILDATQRAPSVRIETNLIIGGVGYDSQ